MRSAGLAPKGDPTAIREHAAFLTAEADRLSEQAAHVSAARMRSTMEGPGSDRLRQRVSKLETDVANDVQELRAVAAAMMGWAGQLEADQSSFVDRVGRLLAEELRDLADPRP